MEVVKVFINPPLAVFPHWPPLKYQLKGFSSQKLCNYETLDASKTQLAPQSHKNHVTSLLPNVFGSQDTQDLYSYLNTRY